MICRQKDTHVTRSNSHNLWTLSRRDSRGTHTQRCFDRRSMLEGRFKSTCVQPAGMQQLSSAGHTHPPKSLIMLFYPLWERVREKQKAEIEKGHCFIFHDDAVKEYSLPAQLLWVQMVKHKQKRRKTHLNYLFFHEKITTVNVFLEGRWFSRPTSLRRSFITHNKTGLFQYPYSKEITCF